MNVQLSFNQGKLSNQVKTILKHLESADLGSPDIKEEDVYQSWGHYQFTASGVSPSSLPTSWKSIGIVPTMFKLVAATLKTCHEAWLMCANARMTEKGGSVQAGYIFCSFPDLNYYIFLDDFSPCLGQSDHTTILL